MRLVMCYTALLRTTVAAVLLLAQGLSGWAQVTPSVSAPAADGSLSPVALRWNTDYNLALKQAAEAGRPVYVYIWAKYNPDCVAMADQTLTYDLVVDHLTAFELIALDAHNRVNFPFFDHYKIPYFRVNPLGEGMPYEAGMRVEGGARYPTSLFLDAQGREVYRMFGFVEGKGFAVVLSRVVQVLKTWDELRGDPTSATLEAQLGHLYMLLGVVPEARKHLEAALKLDPENESALHPDIKLDLIIMGIPEEPGPAPSLQALQQWQKQNGAHPRRLEALYYEAVAQVALGELDAALRLLLPFKQAQPGSLEYESQWYMPALQLVAGLEDARRPAPPPGR